MSLITAYFKKEATSVDTALPEVSQDTNGDASKVKCPESVNHTVDLLLDEDSNLKAPIAPKRMKIALFTSHEASVDLTAECITNNEAEQSDKLQDELSVHEGATMTTAITEDSRMQEQVTVQLSKQQSRQTTLKFENGKCVLVPMDPSAGIETASQESSQVDSTTEDEYRPKKQQAKRKKKSKWKNTNDEDNFVKEVEPSVTKKRSRKAAKEAVKQLSQEAGPPQSCTLSKLTSEDDQVKLLPEILVVDSDNVEETVTALHKDGNKEETTIKSPTVVVENEMVMGDSSDSDVICLTPHSASPLSQESVEQPRSRPSTPAKNKWSHIFGIKSPQKKSPSRKSSPCKGSPRKSNHAKQVAMALSSLTTSHEQYTLGIPLFHHIMQQDNSLLWALPKVELSNINARLTTLSRSQPHTAGASQGLSKRLITSGSEVQRNSFHLKFVTSGEKDNVLNQLNVKYALSLCRHFTLLNQQLAEERSRLLAEWASWEEQVRLVQSENEKLEKEVVEVPEDPPLELIVSIRFLQTDIASESVTVDAAWYNKQQENSHTTYNLRCRRQQQSWKQTFKDSDSDSDSYRTSLRLQKRSKKRKKRLSRLASDDEDSSWSDGECEKKEIVTNSAPKKTTVLTKPLPGPPYFKPLNDSWVDLYAPRQPDHILGNQAAIQMMCQWLTNWKGCHSGIYSNNKSHKRKVEQSDCIVVGKDSDDSDTAEEEGVSKVMLVRGPVGCGKTSAIYACAGKLGYKVFELNSSSKRSGSQVISILQEATQSHQITTQPKAMKYATSSQDDEEDVEDKPNDTQEVKPSRTITSFFKPIGGGANKDGSKSDVAQNSNCRNPEDDHFRLTLASHTVILIEEVDILFEEDKGFWSAVYDIIASSRRPVICTCNDPCLELGCHHSVIDMKTPSVHDISNHLQIIALSHDLYIPAEVACTLTAMLHCDTRHVIHTLHYALCHANAPQKNPSIDAEPTVPAIHPASVLEQLLIEAKAAVFSDLFLTNVVHHLKTMNNSDATYNSRLQRPWCNHRSKLKTSQSKRDYVQLDTVSNACDWLSECDIIGSSENSSVPDPYSAHHWWEVVEQSCLLDVAHQLPGELEGDKIRKQQDEITLFMEHLTEQNFSVANSQIVGEEIVLKAAENCRRCEEFNADMLAVVQCEFTCHYQLLHSALATDFLPYMYVMCKSEEARKARQRRFRHYLSARGVGDISISSLLHHQKLLT